MLHFDANSLLALLQSVTGLRLPQARRRIGVCMGQRGNVASRQLCISQTGKTGPTETQDIVPRAAETLDQRSHKLLLVFGAQLLEGDVAFSSQVQ